jgi:hypothetical protein
MVPFVELTFTAFQERLTELSLPLWKVARLYQWYKVDVCAGAHNARITLNDTLFRADQRCEQLEAEITQLQGDLSEIRAAVQGYDPVKAFERDNPPVKPRVRKTPVRKVQKRKRKR